MRSLLGRDRQIADKGDEIGGAYPAIAVGVGLMTYGVVAEVEHQGYDLVSGCVLRDDSADGDRRVNERLATSLVKCRRAYAIDTQTIGGGRPTLKNPNIPRVYAF